VSRIDDEKYKNGFFANPRVTSILEKAQEIQEEGEDDETKKG
jgi:hypothetical protein